MPAHPVAHARSSLTDADRSRALAQVAIDYCHDNAPLTRDLTSDDVGSTGAFLLSPMSAAVTGVTMYVDNGMHAMGQAREEVSKPLFERKDVLTPEECLGSGAIRGDGKPWDAPYE